MRNIGKSKIYIVPELTADNEQWINPGFGNPDLQAHYDYIKRMVKEKTGRAMQEKERERKGKNGKIVKVAGCSPIREGVLLIRPDTTLADVQKFGEECQRRWGITPLQIFLHKDEGHWLNGQPEAEDKESFQVGERWFKPNYHAHIVFDWMNHDTGKSCKLDEKAMSEMQTVLAECLEMERGISKEITGKEHLERTDFILAKQKQEAERVQAEKEAALAAKEEAEKERQIIEGENKAKEQYRRALDTEIADKERQLKDERKAKMDSILDSVNSLVGVGKSAAVEKENAKLKAENERIKKSFPDAVKNKVEELTKVLVAEKQKVEAERDRALVQNRSLTIERDKAVKQLQEQQANEQKHIRQAVGQATAEKDKTIRLLESALAISRKLLNAFANFLYHTSEIFKRAIQTIIHFGTEQHQSFFAPSEAADIKSVMQEYGETAEQQKAIGAWLCGYAESRQPFDEIKHRHTLKEVGDVAEGKYDWKIESIQQRLQR